MPVVNCPIDIPEDWEFVRYGVPKQGEYFMDRGGEPVPVYHDFDSEGVVIRRACPAIDVGDWVRVNSPGHRYDMVIGTVDVSETICTVAFEDGGESSFHHTRLTKQTRTIEPYTIDQLMVEAAKRGRHVQCGSKSTIIESVHIAGVTLSCPSIGFMSYVEAAKSLTWSSGEAFGTETWRDAE